MSSSEEPPAPSSETSQTSPATEPPARPSTGGFSEHGDADTPLDADVPPPPADRSPIRPETAALAAAAATEADQACDSTAAFLADTAPSTPSMPKTKQSKALAAIASELVCSICCSVAARAVVANPCGHVFCGGCLERWLRRKRNCPNCQQQAAGFVAVPALDHVVSALVDASPNLRRRDSIDRRRNRSPVPPTPPPPPSNGFVTAAELLRRSNGAVPPPPTPADTTILGAVRALDPRSDIERAVEGLDGLALAGGRSDLERAVDRLNDLPRASPARTPPVRARRGTGRVSLVERQRQHTAERLARRPPRAPVGAPYRASPRTPSAATPPGPRRWRNP